MGEAHDHRMVCIGPCKFRTTLERCHCDGDPSKPIEFECVECANVSAMEEWKKNKKRIPA